MSDAGDKQPDDFGTIVRRYVAVSPFAKQMLATKSRAPGALMNALLAKAPDPASIRRQLELPTTANAKLGANSESWLSTHHPDWVARTELRRSRERPLDPDGEPSRSSSDETGRLHPSGRIVTK